MKIQAYKIIWLHFRRAFKAFLENSAILCFRDSYKKIVQISKFPEDWKTFGEKLIFDTFSWFSDNVQFQNVIKIHVHTFFRPFYNFELLRRILKNLQKYNTRFQSFMTFFYYQKLFKNYPKTIFVE